jgi:uncharacterized protein (DUF2336 family)
VSRFPVHWAQTGMQLDKGLIRELDARLAISGPRDGARLAAGLTDLLLQSIDRLEEAQLALFDSVLLRLVDAIEIDARCRLAERLAPQSNAPSGIVRKLALDAIVVARPLLVQSPRLTDDDLAAIALTAGRDHMLAISERAKLSERLTDALVEGGDRLVVNVLAGNPGARFSESAFGRMVARSARDDILLARLRDREDVPQRHIAILIELAKEAARQRIVKDGLTKDARIVGLVVDDAARAVAEAASRKAAAYRAACVEVEALNREGGLDERALAGFARQRKAEHAVAALSMLADIQLGLAEKVILTPGADTPLLVGRGAGLSWRTVRALLSLRDEGAPGPAEIARMAESFERLNPDTARRVTRFLHAREAAVTKAR